MHIIDFIPTALLMEGSVGRILQHVEAGTPFVTMSAFRRTKRHTENLKNDARLRHILRGMRVSYIRIEGEYREKGADKLSPELSYFVMAKAGADTDTHRLLIIGKNLMARFEQDSILFGDGESIWLVEPNETTNIGDRMTLRPEIIAKLEGFSMIKGRKFGFMSRDQFDSEVTGAATYGDSTPTKPLDRIRQLP